MEQHTIHLKMQRIIKQVITKNNAIQKKYHPLPTKISNCQKLKIKLEKDILTIIQFS